ncbi:MAG: hypothetical protein EOP11_16335 [Proteobacteria bacterium]|nr:MAG: hypothetical protein EOP11_16335 [Pseudomonadota bacterium]
MIYLFLLLFTPASSQANYTLEQCHFSRQRAHRLPFEIEDSKNLLRAEESKLDSARARTALAEALKLAAIELARAAERELDFIENPEEKVQSIFPAGPSLDSLDSLKRGQFLWAEAGRGSRRRLLSEEQERLGKAIAAYTHEHSAAASLENESSLAAAAIRATLFKQEEELTMRNGSPEQGQLLGCELRRAGPQKFPIL